MKKSARAVAQAQTKPSSTQSQQVDRGQKSHHVGRDEPMLWTMFIELMPQHRQQPAVCHQDRSLAGKLGKVGKGDAVPSTGLIATFTMKTWHRMIGVAVIAFDNDLRSKNQIKDGYDAAAAALNQAIVDHFPQIRVC
jgi:hypothetical protein